MLSTINYKTGDNDGLMTDLSFTQHNHHGRQLYHNGYANVYINGFLNIATVVRDSSLRVSTDKDTLIEEFVSMRIKLAAKQLDNTARANHLRKEIARAKTVLREKMLGAKPGEAPVKTKET